jgi:signal transduction histidine kinase
VIPLARAALSAPVSRRARLDWVWCVAGVLLGTACFAVIAAAIEAPLPAPTALSPVRGGPLLVLLIVLLTATGTSRTITGWYRRWAARLLGVQIPTPPPIGVVGGVRSRLTGHLGDTASWRATTYLLARAPFCVLQYYALVWWVGVFNLTYPFWWGVFRNHKPGVQLDPVPVITPFGWFHVATLTGTVAVFVAGAGMVLAAPWVTRAVNAADQWLMAVLLGEGGHAQRVRHLEESRGRVLNDSATTLRRIERDLHDGTQAHITTLAMKLGQAKEKLDHSSDMPIDPATAVKLVDEAHRHAKCALAELRGIIQGIHPPALDLGLDAALATLVARSPVPARLTVDATVRPSRAIESIAYFSVAELLANVATHSCARHAEVAVSNHDGVLHLCVHDDGAGGARLGAGSGLTGLADRINAVDGHLDVSSPPGGPTLVTVNLPLHA